mmetsp:Transcript_26423/g.59297  ORF Transcript_26423/g.59297 Transcript_26423/m.59297 type:complete len:336 (-) Transcript_26423:403-1410(-)
MDPTVISIPEERVVDGKSFPLTLDYSDHSLEEICTWVAANKEKLDDLLRDHRGILLRCGSQADSYQAFHDIVDSTGLETMEYIGGAAVRTQLTPRVFTANESPASEQIPFHHELAQTPEPPTHVLFFCEVPPTSDGETPILVSSEVYDRMNTLHPQFMSAIEARGLKYVRVMPEHDDPSSAIGRGWRTTFGHRYAEHSAADPDPGLRSPRCLLERVIDHRSLRLTSVGHISSVGQFDATSICSDQKDGTQLRIGQPNGPLQHPVPLPVAHEELLPGSNGSCGHHQRAALLWQFHKLHIPAALVDAIVNVSCEHTIVWPGINVALLTQSHQVAFVL